MKVLATNHSSKENSQGVTIFTDEPSVTGYVTNLKPVSQSHDRKRRYFQFTLQTENIVKRVVCFSPEMHKLLTKIKENETRCHLKRFKVTEKN